MTLGVYVPSSSVSPLNYIETISDNLTSMLFMSYAAPPEHLPWAADLESKGGIRLSNIIKENKILKQLLLHIPLGNTTGRAIIKSLKHNHTLTLLRLSKVYHSQYFSRSELEALDRRIRVVCVIIFTILYLFAATYECRVCAEFLLAQALFCEVLFHAIHVTPVALLLLYII